MVFKVLEKKTRKNEKNNYHCIFGILNKDKINLCHCMTMIHKEIPAIQYVCC